MFNISGNLNDLLKLPLKIMVALCISSGLTLFLPNKIIEKIFMLKFRDDFGFILGLVFIISFSIILCNIVLFLINLITNKKNNIVNIKDLNDNEKDILKKFYNKDLSKFINTPVIIAENDKSFPILKNLVNRNILKDKSDMERLMSYDGSGVAYNLTKYAITKLNNNFSKIYK